jgi:hypothetical protein
MPDSSMLLNARMILKLVAGARLRRAVKKESR